MSYFLEWFIDARPPGISRAWTHPFAVTDDPTDQPRSMRALVLIALDRLGCSTPIGRPCARQSDLVAAASVSRLAKIFMSRLT